MQVVCNWFFFSVSSFPYYSLASMSYRISTLIHKLFEIDYSFDVKIAQYEKSSVSVFQDIFISTDNRQ